MSTPTIVLAVGGLTPPFVGILDTLSTMPVWAVSVDWLLTANYEGPAWRCERVSDNAEQDIVFDDNGNSAAAAAAFIGGSSGLGATVYDQIASANITQGTSSARPLYTTGLMNSNPGVVAQDTGDTLGATLASPLLGNPAFTRVWVGRVGTAGSNALVGGAFLGDFDSSATIGRSTLTPENKWWIGGSFQAGAASRVGTGDASYHVFIVRHASGGSTDFWIDGVQIATGADIDFNLDSGAIGFNGYYNAGGRTADAALLTDMLFDTALGDPDIALLISGLADRYL